MADEDGSQQKGAKNTKGGGAGNAQGSGSVKLVKPNNGSVSSDLLALEMKDHEHLREYLRGL